MESARGESCPRTNVEVPPQPMRMISHPWIRNPSKSLQLQQPGDENGDHPGRHRPARCGNSIPTGWLLVGWGSWSQHAARGAPRANTAFSPHSGRIRSHHRTCCISILLNLRPPEEEIGDPTDKYRPVRCGDPNPTGRLLVDWSSWSNRAARATRWASAKIPPHPGRTQSHLRIRRPSKSRQLLQPTDERKDPLA